ncbi:hypothetical protein BT96DRAFT_1007994 [Gymnopus androsaceus JB14]|uniref:Uncharacterized protein n=1 Tax=Gymnopus androsaceus JB14 TaxID=1447944 RepID=A0A6A4GFZ5_9AGAR|nr:hypothetical protein BT96DRAFT_1007994 [Gymnopus androsaceus JB14]
MPLPASSPVSFALCPSLAPVLLAMRWAVSLSLPGNCEFNNTFETCEANIAYPPVHPHHPTCDTDLASLSITGTFMTPTGSGSSATGPSLSGSGLSISTSGMTKCITHISMISAIAAISLFH